jgi:hypothetical protein
MHLVFNRWPGRYQWLLADKLRTRIFDKGKSRIRLVDMEQKKIIKLSTSPSSNIVYPPLEDRAKKYGFISMNEDDLILANIKNLLRALILNWYLTTQQNLHIKSLRRGVEFKVRKGILYLFMKKWIALTPSTSKRVSIWIINKR